MNIGNKIKFFREKQGISMDELATALDVSKSTVSRYENNKREPNIDTLQNIAIALGVTINELVGLTKLEEDMQYFKNRQSELTTKINEVDLNIKNVNEIYQYLKSTTRIIDNIKEKNEKGENLSEDEIIEMNKLINSVPKHIDAFFKIFDTKEKKEEEVISKEEEIKYLSNICMLDIERSNQEIPLSCVDTVRRSIISLIKSMGYDLNSLSRENFDIIAASLTKCLDFEIYKAHANTTK